MAGKRLFKRLLKITGWVAGILILLAIIFLVVVYKKKDAWFLEGLQAYLTKSQSGHLEIDTVDLRLLRNFPYVTLELRGVNYYEHADSIRPPGEMPILRAERIYLAFETKPLLSNELKVREITLSSIQLNIVEYADHSLNLTRAMASPVKLRPPAVVVKKKPATPAPSRPATPPPPPPSLLIDLEELSIRGVGIQWIKAGSEDTSLATISTIHGTFRQEGNDVRAAVEVTGEVQKLYRFGMPLPSGDVTLASSLRFDKRAKTVHLEKGELHYNAFALTMNGTYGLSGSRPLDLSLDMSAENLMFLSFLLRPEVLRHNPGTLKKGDVYLKGRVFGDLAKNKPLFNLSFGMKGLTLNVPGRPIAFRNLGFEGTLVSGDAADYSDATVSIERLRGQLPGGNLQGRFRLRNFKDPFLDYDLSARLQLDGIDEIFLSLPVYKLGGFVAVDGKFNGSVKEFATHKVDNSRSSRFAFKDVSFRLNKTNLWVAYLSGQIENRYNEATIRNLSLRYGNNDILVNARVKNLVYWLIKGEKELLAEGQIRCGTLSTQDLLFDTLQTADVRDIAHNVSLDFSAKTTVTNDSGGPAIDFDIRRLSARFEKLPDIVSLRTWGRCQNKLEGFSLRLDEFQAQLPHGKVELSGGFIMPDARRMQLDARLYFDDFPWSYLQELIAEISDDADPKRKSWTVDSMTIVNGSLDLDAEIETYPFDIHKINVRKSRAHVMFPDKRSISAENLEVHMEPFLFRHPENSGALTGLRSATGTISMKRLNISGFNEFDIRMKLQGTDNRTVMDFVRSTQWSKGEKGRFITDYSGDVPHYSLQVSTKKADLAFFLSKYYKKDFMSGFINYSLDLKATGPGWRNAKKSASGTIDIFADSLLLHGMDIDKTLEKFERSQHFNLTDIGAVVVAGPVGLAITKGTDFVSLAAVSFDSTQRTPIVELASKWQLRNQEIISSDVAFSTEHSRIAFNGNIDFAHDSIPGMNIAVVDRNGCSLMDQTLYGKTNALQSGKLNIAKTLLGSVINVFEDVAGGDCKVVYSGRIRHPEKKN